MEIKKNNNKRKNVRSNVTESHLIPTNMCCNLGQYQHWQDRLIFETCPVPWHIPVSFPTRISRYREIWLESTSKEDSSVLHGVWFGRHEDAFENASWPPEEKHIKGKHTFKRHLALVFHGNCQSIQAWGPLADELNALGYDVLIPDYRQFGRSRGILKESTLYQDARKWWDLAVHYLRYGPDHITIHGISIGTTIAIHLAYDIQSSNRLLVLEMPFDQLYTLAQKHIGKILSWLGWPLFKYTFDNTKRLSKLTCPISTIHAKDDPIIPYESYQILMKSLKDKEFPFLYEQILPSGGHAVRMTPFWNTFLQHCYPHIE
ncbi:MAG: alpha/beta hydrolase [Sylvanvirus sp.]|uniref:Alpha/beta hydrolase n=1 Tax=Sylvanvirus sp. TaxID=2487774 RepID=A0A3G5AIK2_9VIRU|nr:MAG: alpha/beta hydrolase [Sylvanvirus sp.]